MDRIERAHALIGHMEGVVRRLGAEVRYEELVPDEEPGSMRGGRCRVRGRELVLIDRRLGVLGRCAALSEALRSFDLKDVYVPPAVRSLLDAQQSESRN